LLVPLAQQHLVAVYVTLTTLQPELARKLEPRAARRIGGCARFRP
jgi:DNA repair photolyase